MYQLTELSCSRIRLACGRGVNWFVAPCSRRRRSTKSYDLQREFVFGATKSDKAIVGIIRCKLSKKLASFNSDCCSIHYGKAINDGHAVFEPTFEIAWVSLQEILSQ
jgi:hypothetical protein